MRYIGHIVIPGLTRNPSINTQAPQWIPGRAPAAASFGRGESLVRNDVIRTWFFLLLATICFLGVCSLSTATYAQSPLCPKQEGYVSITQRPLDSMLYRVTDCDGDTSYLLGTLHSSDESIIDSITYSIPYLKQSKEAWFELVSQPGDQAAVTAAMLLPNSRKHGLKHLLGARDFQTMVSLFRARAPHVPEAYLDRYKPWAAAVALQIMTIDTTGVVMDDQLQVLAKRYGVKRKALETVRSQFAMFEQLSEQQQLTLLRDAIEGFNQNAAEAEELVAYYKAGELQEILALSKETFARMPDRELGKTLEQFLVHDRNAKMATSLLPSMRRGGAFVAVGALHLPDASGLLQALERAGFGVEAVYPLAVGSD